MDIRITRFAPSPTGYLHLGHAYAAFFAKNLASSPDQFLLRIEDIDHDRCHKKFETAIFEDLSWLGLNWVEPVVKQSTRNDAYQAALEHLKSTGLLYPCFCSRRDIATEIENAGHAPHHTPEGMIYPGTCRNLSSIESQQRIADGAAYALRLNIMAANDHTGPLYWHDQIQGQQRCRVEMFGDAVLARKDISNSYHLSVTVDDHFQKINLVTRGQDLFTASHVHRLLQALLGFTTPDYHHHPLITDQDGKRLAKRFSAASIRDLKNKGLKPEAVLKMAGCI